MAVLGHHTGVTRIMVKNLGPVLLSWVGAGSGLKFYPVF